MVVTQCMMCPFFAVILVHFVDFFNFSYADILTYAEKNVNDI